MIAPMTSPFRVLAFAGSLRKKSYNRALLRTAISLAPSSLAFETADFSDVPVYNGDVEAEGFPAPVQALRERVAAADGLFIVTPEYNCSIPGAFKNTIDWISRPPSQPFDGKPASIIGASIGDGGTMRSQVHWRQVAVNLNLHLLNRPEIFVRRAQDKFDADGNLTDEALRTAVVKHMEALAAWIAIFKK